MSYSNRFLGVLESELSRQLSFSFRLDAAAARRGPAPLRARDVIELVVSVRNDASFPFRAIRGSIDPTPYTAFAPLPFSIARLEPGETRELGTLSVLVAELPERGDALDQLAAVSLSASADLSLVVFHEWDKPLAYAAPSLALRTDDLAAATTEDDGRAAVRAQGTARANDSFLRGPY